MIIYKTTNLINEKIYIGKDSRNKKNYLGGGVCLAKAIKKYGRKNFKKETICECKTQEELNEKEIYYINLYKSTDSTIGYNLSTGGGSSAIGVKLSEETRRKMSMKRRGKKLSEEHRKKIALSNTGRKQTEYAKQIASLVHKGKKLSPEHKSKFVQSRKHTEETKAKISKAHTGKKLSPETREKLRQVNLGKIIHENQKSYTPIIEYDINMNFVKEWKGLQVAANELGIARELIGRVCRGKHKHTHNKIFRYKE